MKIEEILDEWKRDAEMDDSDLSTESLRIPRLKVKYNRYYIEEFKAKLEYENIHKKLLTTKRHYYKNEITLEKLKELGWEGNNVKMSGVEAKAFAEADEDVLKLNKIIILADEKCKLIKEITAELHQRSFNIKNAIEFQKFQAGIG
jgi:hypothetical protein